MSALLRTRGLPSDSEMLGLGTAHFLYRDRHFRTEAIKVLPGEYYATASELMIVTLLGSCVAACIFDPVARVGGMNHFLLPGNPDRDGSDQSRRYGVFLMEKLLNGLFEFIATTPRLHCRVEW